MSMVDPVPPGQAALTPHIIVRDAARAIDFYKRAFGATEEFRLAEPSGRVGHAELRVGGALLQIADEYPDFGALSPQTVGGCPMTLHLYVPDVDAALDRAVAAGAILVRRAKDEFYGDRTGTVADPFGFNWRLASRIAQVTPAEMQARWTEILTAA